VLNQEDIAYFLCPTIACGMKTCHTFFLDRYYIRAKVMKNILIIYTSKIGSCMKYWKMRNIKTGLFLMGGINAEFNEDGKEFKNKVGIKSTLFHYVYGFKVDDDGVRRFHPRGSRTVNDFEAVCFGDHQEVEVIPGRNMFTGNQLLNKEDRILDDLSPDELKAEIKKQF
jgi:hypothetical protein